MFYWHHRRFSAKINYFGQSPKLAFEVALGATLTHNGECESDLVGGVLRGSAPLLISLPSNRPLASRSVPLREPTAAEKSGW
jgi:hypothetical protein